LLDNHDVENMDGPKALDNPPGGKVNDPDLSRLFRSVTAEDEAIDAL
jgi:hypothetical protein